jgi:cytochrome o ubiquinol oxidase subunit IV
MKSDTLSRLVGLIASLLLTGAAFLIFFRPDFFRLSAQMNIAAVLILATVQCTVQSIFFLHILSEKGPRWNLVVYASTLSIIFIILFFSIWIMNNLNARMM